MTDRQRKVLKWLGVPVSAGLTKLAAGDAITLGFARRAIARVQRRVA